MFDNFKDEVYLLLNQIDELAPETKNQAVQDLKRYQYKLTTNTFTSEHVGAFQHKMLEAYDLLTNLRLAKEATEYVKVRLIATNNPISVKDSNQLEVTRQKLNDTDLRYIFGTLKNRREQLKSAAPGIEEFKQIAYPDKGTGFNMAMWYWHASQSRPKQDKSLKFFGNCTEQGNTAFVYLYTVAREKFSNKQPSPFKSLHRVDVQNDLGGHSFIIVDGGRDISTRKVYTDVDFLIKVKSLPTSAVILDPWHSECPFYPAADIVNKMPKCGQVGKANIEFGLVLSEEENTPSLRNNL